MNKFLSLLILSLFALPVSAFDLIAVGDQTIEENQDYQGPVIVATGLSPPSTLTFSLPATDVIRSFIDIFGGEELYPDNSLFTIDPDTGEVFLSAKDYEIPEDLTPYRRRLRCCFYYQYTPISEKGLDNVYGVVVMATDESGNEELVGWNLSIEDVPEGDDDGDGVLTRYEIAEGTDPYEIDYTVTRDYLDTDQDQLPDAVELDSDADGISNLEESNGADPYGDADGDYIPNYLDATDRGDGIAASCTADGSGKFCQYDPVSRLALDPLFDFNQDGEPNFRSSDSDNDTIDDILETAFDFDGDLIPNYLDRDSDNDFVPDIIEPFAVVDLDFNYFDMDADGIPDTLEATLNNDHDSDGIDDYYDIDLNGGTDFDGDGIVDGITAPDADGDTVPNFLDVDSDNDALPDQFEADSSGLDDDDDGIDDTFDIDYVSALDANGDGIVEMIVDTDGDGLPDYLDLDSDNDSLTDLEEIGVYDREEDGLSDEGFVASLPLSTDFRNVLTASGELVVNLEGYADFDADNDGRIDVTSDVDVDGIDNSIDTAPFSFGLKPIDTDNDGVTNYLDFDDDGDGIADTVEGDFDHDRDGIINRLDPDSDNDGITDLIESGLPELIGDSNGNTIDDSIDIVFVAGDDNDNDGAVDHFIVRDVDGDGLADYIDTDSDNDQIPDYYENEDKDNDFVSDRLQSESAVRTAGSSAGAVNFFMISLLLFFFTRRRLNV